MMKRFREIFRHEAGFTLIELLVVIAVLGILAGIAVPRITGVQDKAIYSTGEAALRNINLALQMYYTENNKYPECESKDLLSDQYLGQYLDNSQEILGNWSIVSYSSTATGEEALVVLENSEVDNNLTLQANGVITQTAKTQ